MSDPWFFPPAPPPAVAYLSSDGVAVTLLPPVARVAQVLLDDRRRLLAPLDVDLASLRPKDPRRVECRTCCWGARVATDIHHQWMFVGDLGFATATLLCSTGAPYAFDTRLRFDLRDREVVVDGTTGPPPLGPWRKLRVLEHVFAFPARGVRATHREIEDGEVFEFPQDECTVRVSVENGFRWCAIECIGAYAVVLLRSAVDRQGTTRLRLGAE